MPSACRRIAMLLVAASLVAILPASAALGQGAGDRQYGDPFGSGTSTAEPHRTATTPATSAPALSSSPQPSGTQGTGNATTSARAHLPNTGLDARVLLLLGAGLLLAGLGLRHRSSPERF